ncbi:MULTISPECIES: LPS export ABC transporter permease LptG [unclassified Nitrosospira]|uniref:LPS export ABC transporter permease LptG n=1 Tax=unclassified Nitrosospira TaxID=2609267 RepID=UPI000D2FBE9A|nr:MULTISPECIES: LPS export ABC transporter permease LptG [unclassified Nitrosospira]PTR15629.1 lipopolysaccharide export system permease protein [Nitrosospira sp. Nsp2]WON74941.1 LPS export ABC transporter permease LptG [Nitrosospira sp. Is2]
MSVINRYLAVQVLIGLGIAVVVLLPLFGFLDLLDQLDDVGKGTYRVQDAFLHTALLLPRRFIQLAPFIALLGNVIALGRLAVGSELTALRVAGVSPIGISLAPLTVGLILLLFIAVLDQFVAPQLQQKAISSRAVALEKSAALGKNLGIWTRDERNILRIGEMLHSGRAADIEIMHFDDNGFLLTYTHAKYADFNGGDLWDLQDATTKTFTGNRIESENAKSIKWRSFLNPDDISTLTKSPESLSPVELFLHVRFLRATGQEADAYALALWRKAGGGLTTIAMLLFSIPFVFGSVRAGLGSRLVLAAMLGIGVYLFDQIIANAGLLLHINPALTALSPGLVLTAVAVLWLRRIF